MLKIIPSILTDNPVELNELIEKSESAVDRVHIDIIDGVFADNKTIFPESVAELETQLFFDYHLMVKEPINWVEKSIRGYADRIIGQVEIMESQEKFVDDVITKGYKAGLALDFDTNVESINEDVLGDLDVILVMSVKAGFGGQDFGKASLNKIKHFDKIRSEKNYRYKICVDGGINETNISDVVSAGADEVSIGRIIFDGNVADNVEKFQKAAQSMSLS